MLRCCGRQINLKNFILPTECPNLKKGKHRTKFIALKNFGSIYNFPTFFVQKIPAGGVLKPLEKNLILNKGTV